MNTQNIGEKAYRAYHDDFYAYGTNPHEACKKFFADHPKKRKCHVIEVHRNGGGGFTIIYGKQSAGQWPFSVEGVTRRTVDGLATLKPTAQAYAAA